MTFGRIDSLFSRENRAKFFILDLLKSPNIGQKSDGGILYFRISDKGIKLEERNTTTLKKIYDDVMSVNYDVIVAF